MNWVQGKIYLYNITFGLYMLDWWERCLFNILVIVLMWFVCYNGVRSATEFGKSQITATPRQIEILICLSEALARIRFSELVEKRDVMEAFRLLEVALQQSATDHTTGTIDMDLITTGVSASERMRRENLISATRNIIMEKLQIGGPSTRILELLDELKKQSSSAEIHLNDLRNALASLASEGFVVAHSDSVKGI